MPILRMGRREKDRRGDQDGREEEEVAVEVFSDTIKGGIGICWWQDSTRKYKLILFCDVSLFFINKCIAVLNNYILKSL